MDAGARIDPARGVRYAETIDTPDGRETGSTGRI